MGIKPITKNMTLRPPIPIKLALEADKHFSYLINIPFGFLSSAITFHFSAKSLAVNNVSLRITPTQLEYQTHAQKRRYSQDLRPSFFHKQTQFPPLSSWHFLLVNHLQAYLIRHAGQ